MAVKVYIPWHIDWWYKFQRHRRICILSYLPASLSHWNHKYQRSSWGLECPKCFVRGRWLPYCGWWKHHYFPGLLLYVYIESPNPKHPEGPKPYQLNTQPQKPNVRPQTQSPQTTMIEQKYDKKTRNNPGKKNIAEDSRRHYHHKQIK